MRFTISINFILVDTTNTIELNDQFTLAFRFVSETSENIFLTGKAGTGKTTLLKYIKEHCAKNIVVAAPTGVAAINAGGVTLLMQEELLCIVCFNCLSTLFYPIRLTKMNCWAKYVLTNSGFNCSAKWSCW